MSQTVDIGAARIHLVVDASDYEPTLNRLKNTAADFGNAAEAAFARSSGKARTAANRLLDYVATLGRAESQLERMVRQASRAGVEAPIIAAAVTEWKRYQSQLEAVERQQRQTNAAFDEAQKINTAFDAARVDNSQVTFNRVLGVEQRDSAEQARRRADAEAAILPLLQRQEREYEQMLALAHQINNARSEQFAQQSQSGINSLLGVQDGARSPAYLAEQRRVVELFNQQAIAEQAVEAEARDIHAQWVAIERQIQSVGRSTYDIMRANVQQKYGAAGAPLIDQINKWEKLNTTISGTTVNTKQLQQAIRFLPAQFTDIGVSLAGGMNPLLVAFQQGGQILDQFRLAGATTGDTLRMIGSYASKLVTPVTVGATALAAFAYAGYDAAKSMEQLAIASAKGYGQAGNANQLYALTEGLNKLENIRLGPAEEAVARLASGGLLVGENFRLAAEASSRWSSITGEAADRVTGQFEAIARDPLQAIESGLVRVTQEQYDQVRALVAVGDQQGAVNLLTKIWYDTINANSAQAEAHLSGVSQLMHAIGDGFGEATRKAGEWFNALALGAADVQKAYNKIIEAGGSRLNPLNAIKALWNPYAYDPNAKESWEMPTGAAARFANPAADKKEEARIRAIEDYRVTANEEAQRRINLQRLEAQGYALKLSKEEVDKVVAQQKAAYDAADAKKNKGGSRGGGTGARTAARDVRYEYQLESALLQTQTREVQAAYAIKSITAEAYYKSLITLAEKEYDVQKRSNAEQLAAIGGKKGQEHEVARLRVADAIAEQQLAQRKIDIQSQQAQYAQQLLQQRRDYTNALWDGVAAQQADFDASLKRMTMGDREFERWNANNELIQEQDRLLRDIRRQVESKAISAEEGALREQAAIDATNAKLMQQAAAYGQIDAARGNWENGASRAWKNWQDEVTDVAGHSEKVFGEAFDTFAEIGTDALTGNLKSWGDYFDSLARMITQFIVKQQLTKWMQSLSQGAGGGGGWWDKAASFAAGLLGGGGGFQASSGGVSGSDFAAVFDDFMGGMATGGTVRPGAFAQVNERGFEMARVGNRDYLLAGAKPVQITPNHKIAAAARGPSSRVVNIQQTFVVQGTPDRSTRDQLRRDNAGATQRSVAKV